jgi:integrase
MAASTLNGGIALVVNKTSSLRAEGDRHSSMSMAQFHVLLEVAHGHRLYPLLILAGTAGLRRAELISLRWADVDLASGTLRVAGPPRLGRVDLPTSDWWRSPNGRELR